MGIGIKCFLVDENDNLINISIKKMEKLEKRDPNINLSEFAGKRIRYVTAIIENQNKKAVSIIRIQGHYLSLDEEGKINLSEFNDEMQISMNMIEIPSIIDNSTNILDAKSKFLKKKFKQSYTWKITPQIEKKIYDKIFVGSPVRLLE